MVGNLFFMSRRLLSKGVFLSGFAAAGINKDNSSEHRYGGKYLGEGERVHTQIDTDGYGYDRLQIGVHTD